MRTILTVGGLILSSVAIQALSNYPQEVVTECFCWCLVLFCSKFYLYCFATSARPDNSSLLGAIAIAVTLLCLSSSVQQTPWSLAPLLAPASVLIDLGSASLPQYEISKEVEGSAILKTTGLVGRSRVIFPCIYAVFALVALGRSETLYSFLLQLCWVLSQTWIYWGLVRRNSVPDASQSTLTTDALHMATALADYMVLMTVPLMVFLWQGTPTSIPLTAFVSILKAGRWVSILFLAHEQKLSPAVWSTLFTVCASAIDATTSQWQTITLVASAIAALYRVSISFPQYSWERIAILTFGLYPLWRYGSLTGRTESQLTTWTPAYTIQHPIFTLAAEANTCFEKMQKGQSQTLVEAVAEYKRRYNRYPPKGYEHWYNFAIENKVQLIDEYDILTKSFDPFWKMSPKILRSYINESLSVDNVRLNVLEVKDHNASLVRPDFQHEQLLELIRPVIKFLPDFTAALNANDEPRVLVPYDGMHNIPKQLESLSLAVQPLHMTSAAHQVIWSSVTVSCPPNSLARSALVQDKRESLASKFISNLAASQDLCDKPASFAHKHGFLGSPSTFHYTDRLAPIMSTARMSTFQDIMMPSSYYFQDDIYKYDESKDVPWEQKEDLVYWRGSSTGGQWSGDSWRMGHRQRFVTLANADKEPIQLLNRTGSAQWSEYSSTMDQVKSKFKAKFSQFIQCAFDACQSQEEFFHAVERDQNDDANKYKILYNLDGNSFSGRYYRFLKSNSLVFMQALFQEWHDDRLIPWVHFVPVGLGMEELPEVTRYFLDDKEGKLVAKAIADRSREWARSVLRPVDLTAAYFRVFLEYARLMDDEREKLDFRG